MAKVALLIGVSEYKPGLNALPAAVRNVEAMRRVLLDPDMGDFDTVKPLTNPDPLTMQLEIETFFSGCTTKDLALLFFSGHGIKDSSGKLYFSTTITSKDEKGELIRATAVPTSFIHQIMNNCRCSRQIIILDCCFSGAFDPALQAMDDGSVDLKSHLGAEGRVVLASSGSIEYSFAPKEADLSIYTHYLVEGIETGAGNQTGYGSISVLDLHEYATSKIRETFPSIKMTPQIIVLKNKGFEIILAKARVTDPKLAYRETALRYAYEGIISDPGRTVLDSLVKDLNLIPYEAAEIEAEVFNLYQERLKNLKQYRKTLISHAESEYPLSKIARKDLNVLQRVYGFTETDIWLIHQEVEEQFTQKSAGYQKNLVQYEQRVIDIIQKEFPFSEETLQNLKSLQQSLELEDKDIALVEQPLIETAELRKQEILKQEAKQKSVERKKKEAETLFELGLSLAEKGQSNEAITNYQKAIRLDSKNAAIHYNLGLLIVNSSHEKRIEAIASFRKAIQLDSNNAEMYISLGSALISKGDRREAGIAYRKAVSIYREAIQSDPNNAEMYKKLGDALRITGERKEGMSAHRTAIQLDPNNAELYQKLGDILISESKIDEGITAYRTAIQLDPSNIDRHIEFGLLLKRTNTLARIDEAISAYRSAIKLDPENVKAHQYLGIALCEKGKIKEAISTYRNALQLYPDKHTEESIKRNLDYAQQKLAQKKFFGLF